MIYKFENNDLRYIEFSQKDNGLKIYLGDMDDIQFGAGYELTYDDLSELIEVLIKIKNDIDPPDNH